MSDPKIPNFREAVCCQNCKHWRPDWEGEGECLHPTVVFSWPMPDGAPSGPFAFCNKLCDLHEPKGETDDQSN